MKTIEFTNEFGTDHYYEIADHREAPFQKLQLASVSGGEVYICLLERKHDLEDRDNPNRYAVVTGIHVPLSDLVEVVARLQEDQTQEEKIV